MSESALDRVMEAMARFMDKPRNPALAAGEFMEVVAEDWKEALLDWEESKSAREDADQPQIQLRQTA